MTENQFFLSRYAHVHAFPEMVAIHHALTQKVVLLDHILMPMLESARDGQGVTLTDLQLESLRVLVEERILVHHASDDEAFLTEVLARAPHAAPDIHNLKLILTNRCNLRCRYCVIEGNLPFGSSCDMPVAIVERALKMFARHARSSRAKRRMVMLYGGEPLLNWPAARFAVAQARTMEQAGELGGPVDIVLESNGTLITPDIAEFLACNNVLIQLSIDGPAEIHDQMRRFPDGSGSHAAAESGFEIARRAGCTCVVSAVFGTHTAQAINYTIRYFAEKLKPLTIGLDLLHLIQGTRNPADVAPDKLAEMYLMAWKEARNQGLFVEHIVRRLRPFLEEHIRWKDCPSCGSRMVVRTDGWVGVCEAFLASGDYYGDYLDSGPPLPNESPFGQWASRSALYYKECQLCEALAVCGRGCGYNAHVQYGDFRKVDEKVCVTSRALLKWAIREISEIPSLRARVRQKSVCVLTPPEKQQILGSVPLHADAVLRTVSEFAEEVGS